MSDIFQAHDKDRPEAGVAYVTYEVFTQKDDLWHYSGSFDTESEAEAAVEVMINEGGFADVLMESVSRVQLRKWEKP
jgi:hypothetical protein